MKIALFDSWKGKFSHAFQKRWEDAGHEVRFNPRWEEADGADLNFFYQADNALIKGTKEVPLTGKIFAQCVDIEVWAGQPFAADWSKVDGCIFMAKHIREYVEENMTFPENTKVTLIKPGINLEKFTLRPPVKFSDPIRRIAYVVGDRRIWDVKRLDIAFQLLRDLLDSGDLLWQLHIRGTYSSHVQYNRYCEHLERDIRIKDFVVWYPDRVEDMNKWLNHMHYFVLPSTKEAFSYATGEAMAKGIKPIINNWEGAKDTWGPYVCETYGQMLAEMTKGGYEPEKYRKYVEERYDEKKYLEEIDKFLGIGG